MEPVTAGLLLGGYFTWLFGGDHSSTEDARRHKFSGAGRPGSREGGAVPIVFGTVKIDSPNMIWFEKGHAAGVRMFSEGTYFAENPIVAYRYYAGFSLSLCLGPDVVLNKIYIENHLAWDTEDDTDPEDYFYHNVRQDSLFGGDRDGGGFTGEFEFHPGSWEQKAVGPLEHTPDFNDNLGISYITFKSAYIGTQNRLRPMSFEVERIPSYLGIPDGRHVIGKDINPAELLYLMLASEWGGLYMNPADLDMESFRACGLTLHDEGLGLSVNIEEETGGLEVVIEILRHINGIIFEDPSRSVLAMKLIRNDFDARRAAVLDETNTARILEYTTLSWDDTLNQVRVEFPNRQRDYKTSVSIVQDMSNIANQNLLQSRRMSYPFCYEPEVALKLAARDLAQYSLPLTKVKMEVNRQAGTGILPGDVVRLNWEEYGINGALLRVLTVNRGSLHDGMVSIECIQEKSARG